MLEVRVALPALAETFLDDRLSVCSTDIPLKYDRENYNEKARGHITFEDVAAVLFVVEVFGLVNGEISIFSENENGYNTQTCGCRSIQIISWFLNLLAGEYSIKVFGLFEEVELSSGSLLDDVLLLIHLLLEVSS